MFILHCKVSNFDLANLEICIGFENNVDKN